jgi:single-stranded DNA-binding protein
MKAKATVVGRLTRDVTSIFSNDDGSAKRALFTVACNSIYKRDNEKVKTTDFIPCIAWGPHADLLKEWGLKGRQVLIEGTIETFQKPADENGNYDPVKVQIRVSQLEFLGFEDNVREKYETNKTATAAPTAGTEAILAALAALVGGQAAATPTPAPEPTPMPQPAAAEVGPEALAAALLGVINNQQTANATPPDISAQQATANELGTLV